MELLKEFLINELVINDAPVFSKLEHYNKLILDWNKKINLISRKLDSVESTILNSIFFLPKFDLSEYNNILDLGTGGGIPGIPLAIIYPGIQFTLNDSVKKKMIAVEDIKLKLKLNNVCITTGRAEELSKEKRFKNKFDIVISKSVSSLKNLYDWGKDFLNKEGKLLCIKGGDIEKEIEELTDFHLTPAPLLKERGIRERNSIKKLGKGKKIEIINFEFDEKYGIEDKKIVIIKI